MTGATWYDRVPKVELHLHLEGAIPHAALWQLVQKYGGDPSIPDIESLIRKFQYRDFPHSENVWQFARRRISNARNEIGICARRDLPVDSQRDSGDVAFE